MPSSLSLRSLYSSSRACICVSPLECRSLIHWLRRGEERKNKNPASRRVFAFDVLSDQPSIVDSFLHGVFHSADSISNLAGELLRLAFAFELGVAGGLACNLFHFPLNLFSAALNAIFVHSVLSFFGYCYRQNNV